MWNSKKEAYISLCSNIVLINVEAIGMQRPADSMFL